MSILAAFLTGCAGIDAVCIALDYRIGSKKQLPAYPFF
jgi:hypothetical protein